MSLSFEEENINKDKENTQRKIPASRTCGKLMAAVRNAVL